MSQIVVKTVRKIGVVVVVALSVYGLCELFPWCVDVTMRKLFRLPSPTASAYYFVEVHNRSSEKILVTVNLLNDTFFEVPSEWKRRQNERMGWLEEKKVIIAAQNKAVVTLPSQVDPRIGYILVVARTRILNSGSNIVFQKMAVYLSRWQSKPLEITVKESDLQNNDLEFAGPKVNVR